MTQRFSVFIILFILATSFFVSSVSAHVLKTDSTIGAVIHIDPEDDPIAGLPAHFYFEFKDREGKFKIGDCDCTFSVSSHNKELTKQPFVSSNEGSDLNSSVVTFTFPERGMYVVNVTGVPHNGTSFTKFTLSYDIRVEREQTASVSTIMPGKETDNYSGPNWRHVLFGGLGIVVVFFLYWFYNKKQ